MEKHNNFQLFLEKNDFLAFIFLYLIIFIQTMLFTSFSTFSPQIAILLAKLLNVIIIGYVIYGLIFRLTIRKLVYFSIISLIILVMFWQQKEFSPFIKLLLLSATVPATIPSSHSIAKIFGLAMGTTLIITIFLSLLGYLPETGTNSRSMFSSYQETVYFLGFNHPNAFGTFISMLFAIVAYIFYEKHKWNILLCAIILFLLNIKIGANTAAVGIIIVISIAILPHSFNKYYKLLYILPSMLTLFSLWLSYNNTSALGTFFNEKVASRPNVWHAYVNQYPIQFVNNPPQVDTNGYFGILGNGVLDGSYIYILIFWGILSWIVYNFIFISLVKFSIDTKNKVLLGIAVLTMVTAFPESHMIMFYENVFLLFFGFFQYPKNVITKCLEL